MSRHLYDLEKMMDTEIGQAINDKELYMSIVEHRRRFIGLKGFDYNTLMPESIDIIPPENVIGAWKKDYTAMQESMIFGDSLPFEELIARLKVLNERINSLSY
ncbi:MAG: nucleotidyl transferase AbiEii/AbiGii toxin family protein [Spirochaetales bacterium]|nr:nucleotidyl transferase AbiEii/AbiGii toxin family protein [Spirochaetales bacterium]